MGDSKPNKMKNVLIPEIIDPGNSKKKHKEKALKTDPLIEVVLKKQETPNEDVLEIPFDSTARKKLLDVVSGYSYADGGKPEIPTPAPKPEIVPTKTDEDKKLEALTEVRQIITNAKLELGRAEKELAEIRAEKTFSVDLIKEKISTLLKSNDLIRKIKNLIVEGRGDIISINIAVEGAAGVGVGVQAELENRGKDIAVKNYNIDANFMVKGKVEKGIVPKLNEITSILKNYIEKEKNKKVIKIWIENGELRVEFEKTTEEEIKIKREEELSQTKIEIIKIIAESEKIEKDLSKPESGVSTSASTSTLTAPETIPVIPPQQSPSPIFNPQTPETIGLEQLLNDARGKYAEEYKKFLAERKGSRKGIRKLANLKESVLGAKIADSETPGYLKELEAEYDTVAIAFGNQMYLEEKARLAKDSALSEDQKDKELKKYKQDKIFNRVVVEEQARLNASKVENLPPREKGVARKLLEWYINIKPSWKKTALSTALSTIVIIGISGASVATVGIIATSAGNRFTRALAGSTVGLNTAKYGEKAYDWLFKRNPADKRKVAEEELAKLFQEETFVDLVKSKKEYAKILEREQNAKRNRLITKAMITIAAGGLTSYGMGYGISHFSENSPDQLQTPGVNNNQPDMAGARVQNEADLKSLVGTKMAAKLGYKPTESLAINQGMDYSAPGVGHDIPQSIDSAPGMGHEITHDFSVKLGEGGVPKNLETVYNEISADYMKVPANGIVDEEFATKSLNVAANLVRLTEHHNVAGITADDFEKVANFKDGVLQIKNPAGFNEIISKLQIHSNELWTKGVLQSEGAAITQIPKISHGNWLKIVHAEGMHEGTALDGTSKTATGLLGHQEVNAEQIKNFNDSEMVKNAIEKGHEKLVANTRAQVLEHIDKETTTPTPTPEPEPQSQPQPQPETILESDTSEDIANNKQLSDALRKQGYTGDPTDRKAIDEFFKKLRDDSVIDQNKIMENLNNHPEFIDNPFKLDPETLMSVIKLHEYNMEHIFKNVEKWEDFSDLKAKNWVHIGSMSEDSSPELIYLNKLTTITGVKPRGWTLFHGRAETNGEYIARALQKAAKIGKLDELKIQE